MKADRLVIHSNVWIAALVSPMGAARRLMEAVLDQGIDLSMSESTFAVLVSRLEKHEFDRYREPGAWNMFLAELVELATWHEDADLARGVCRDPDDDRLLALAVTGQVDAIISSARDLLEIGGIDGIPVLAPAKFLQRLRKIPDTRLQGQG